MRFTKIVFSLLLLINTSAFAQQRNCGTMEHLEYLESQDPGLLDRMNAIERFTERALAAPNRAVTGVATIPVAVHVVFNNSTENISDAQVLSQINILNEDFRRMNADADNTWPQAADSEVEFCLATVDPNGNPTTGITRTPTSVNSFGSSGNPVKFASSGGHNAWPASDYLNIWVCDLAGGLLGYAQFPGGNAATDGIVVDYAYFGNIGTATPPFHLGRTATHEVGHWLNLRHIWGDGPCGVDDFVADTPLSDASNFGCPANHVSCGSVDMVQNYMDYTDDACMNLFTQGQKSRMQALFGPGGFRESLLNSTACGNTNPQPSCNDGIQNGNETGVDCGGTDCQPCPCSGENIVTLHINFDNNPGQTTWQILDNGGGMLAAGGPYSNYSPGSSVTEETCLPDGCYDFTIFDSGNNGLCCFFGFGSFSLTDDNGNSLASGSRFGSSLSANFCLTNNTASCNDGIQNGNETGVDCGGPDCAPCISCNDGIQNGNETGVDCGGPDCAPCISCNDGIQNGNETGVDCGGADCLPCSPETCSYTLLNSNNFENSLGIWIDGGTDCLWPNRYYSFSNSGIYNVLLRDNTSSSVLTTSNLDLSGAEEIRIDFTYITAFFSNSNDDFWLQLSTDGGSTYSLVEEWNYGDEFQNEVRKFESLVIPGPFSANTRLRFRCDASDDFDFLFLDDVSIQVCTPSARASAGGTQNGGMSITEVALFPNPVEEQLTVSFYLPEEAGVETVVTDITGRRLLERQAACTAGWQEMKIDVGSLASGVYFIHLKAGGERVSRRFVVAR